MTNKRKKDVIQMSCTVINALLFVALNSVGTQEINPLLRVDKRIIHAANFILTIAKSFVFSYYLLKRINYHLHQQNDFNTPTRGISRRTNYDTVI